LVWLIEGRLLDLYPENDSMVIWLKTEDGSAIRLADGWLPSLYVDLHHAEAGGVVKSVEDLITSYSFCERFVDPSDRTQSRLLKLEVAAKNLKKAAERLELSLPYGSCTLYNVDVSPSQSYLYEHDIFPLARVKVSESQGKLGWGLVDSTDSTDYDTSFLKVAHATIHSKGDNRLGRFSEPIGRIDMDLDGERLTLDQGSEGDKILSLVEVVKELDPDVVLTEDGDSFTLPYICQRAQENLLGPLILGRDPIPLVPPTSQGRSYFSYGKTMYRAPTIRLYGRVHLDESNTFMLSECNLDGLLEVARMCRIPLHEASRGSIGKLMSSLQFCHAYRKGILVPWRPSNAEHFKSAHDLLIADRGGFIFEPRVGLFENVGEIDFASLFPNIMLKFNISGETVLCDCCPDSPVRVPELDYNVCVRSKGIVPITLEELLRKRTAYKKLMKEAKDENSKKLYNARQTALKWVLVCCLARDSPILIQRNGFVEYVKIGDLIDSLVSETTGVINCPPGIFVAGVDRDLKTRFCRIRKLIKVPRRSKLLSIIMEDGREIIATSDHPFYILKDGGLRIVPGSKLEKGDLVPVAKKISTPQTEAVNIDLIEKMGNLLEPTEQLKWKVSGHSLRNEIANKRKLLLDEARGDGYTTQAVYAWAKTGIIPLKFFKLLGINHESHKELLIGNGRRTGGRTVWLPATLPISEELGFLLGLYVADGSATRKLIRIDIGSHEKDLLNDSRQVAESVFGISFRTYKGSKANMYVLQSSNTALIKILEHVFELQGNAEKGKLKVPTLCYNSRVVAEGFIEGLLAGDGSVNRARNRASIATASKEFANQIGFLAATLGLGFAIGNHSRKAGNQLFTVDLVGPETLRKIASWRFLKNSHRAILKPKLAALCEVDCAHPLYQMFPVSVTGLRTLARAARTVRDPRMDRHLRLCPIRAGRALDKVSSKELEDEFPLQTQRVRGLFESDLGFAYVKEVKELQRADEYVYCFEVDEGGLQGFFSGSGAVYTHNCFGYLGFRNAKFGRIDSHMAVCAFARKILLDATRVAERDGFRVLHGIVDSLWLQKEGANEEDYTQLCREIEREIGFKISFEGIYRWIAFLPSKVDNSTPVLNRYFGVFRNGEVKLRGVEARRRDTPRIISLCQLRMLNVLAQGKSAAETKKLVPGAIEVLLSFGRATKSGLVPVSDLLFERQVSKSQSAYINRTPQTTASRLLIESGANLQPGRIVRFLITDSESGAGIPEELLEEGQEYDVAKYLESLAASAATILEPFGYDKSRLKDLLGMKAQADK